jgi:hypothetical protein
MNFTSKKTPLIILAVTSILSSRPMFFLFNDPEGPNLLVVIVMAAIVYFLSLAVYLFTPVAKLGDLRRLLLTILAQIVIVTVLYFLLK